ncbi:sugar ABC transporter ATP-binding protein [Burkholderia cenocepacia]|uniref:sugar ABC transporter ATP-binding protein n=5 Tax=Burkholderia cenocepacia TaxID=95486 RepID=UPI00098256C0|nr:sugar ABC transporter ATP-binding protein [Burkholderia cenocepacia]MBR8247736.1 sugar ABC transporter ATP-binding protein [Burkholderia cenocepacia]MBR8285645.1 sugar ABC transporter ATP-binding protein [Burkholderia cenocepacia]MBR8499021.1 sugar ABC transporter ATP-binding protein [Burkholderia cenocepacia]MCA8005627.1 sugar ABC transporter ATP-binding protein [Burkholderia cenocepacia]MDN7627507.1 sugar ABC transporter ATP-binding protein [Burkholderia cenocepacia]
MNGATNETMEATRREARPRRSVSLPVLSATGVAKRFDATVALAALDLSIGAGEVVALMGANGAGKSTFVKILSGALQADDGTLTLRGEPYRPASPHMAKRLGVATVHQSVADAVVPTLSIADNLLLDRLCDPTSPWRAPPAARRAAARSLAERVGLDVDLATPLASLSLADQQRVTLARALAGQPSLLILDEPTASLSATEAERLFELVDALRRDGVAILLVSHRLGDLRRIADRAAIVRDGRIVADLAAPIDFDAAVETMIGRPLPRTRAPAPALAPARAGLAGSGSSSGSGSGFSVRQIRLTPTSMPFDLEVRRGEIVAIAGPVGGGKSRFARTIFGAVRAAAGEMTLDGRPWRPRSPADAIRAGVFLAGEDRWRTSLFPDSVPFASIAGTIGFPFLSRWFAGGAVRRARERTAAAAAIARFGIRCEGPDDRVAHLSGGNQQKVVLARWHAEPARLLLLDEPFQGIDAGARADIVDTLRRHAHERTTIVFVSDLEEAAEIADRIVRFDRATLDGLSPTSSIVGACS